MMFPLKLGAFFAILPPLDGPLHRHTPMDDSLSKLHMHIHVRENSRPNTDITKDFSTYSLHKSGSHLGPIQIETFPSSLDTVLTFQFLPKCQEI